MSGLSSPVVQEGRFGPFRSLRHDAVSQCDIFPTFRTAISTSLCPFEDGSTALIRNAGEYSVINTAPFPMRIILRNVAVRTASVTGTSILLSGKVGLVFNLEPHHENVWAG